MLTKVMKLLSCKRKRNSAEVSLPKKKPRESLNCGLCNNIIAVSRTLPCGDAFCEVCINEHFLNKLVQFTQICPNCNYDCHKIQPYPCFLLDEVALNEGENNQEYQTRVENNKTYREKLKVKEIEEGMKIDAKDSDGI